MDVSIVIVSFNTADLTLACLASLKTAARSAEIFVVDNASTDDSVAAIRRGFPDGTLQPSVSYRYPSQRYTRGETSALTGSIACVLGAFMITPRKLMDDLHGFDEDFFLYGEDQDLCWRVRERGLAIGYIQEAEVYDLGGQSEKGTPTPAVFEKKLHAEYLFYDKHYTPKTISRIKRNQAIKARYRLITLGLTGAFARDPEAHADKVASYRIALRLAAR